VIVGLGLDVVEVARVRALVERHGARARRRIFTPGEIAYAERRADPAKHYAARFAAKEAAFKALAGNALARSVSWQDLEVANEADGRPVLRLHGVAAARARELGVRAAWLTLSHTDGVAAATVVLEGDGPPAGAAGPVTAPASG
jgi:holo-[acyl-carrier protein] synthase